MRDTQTDRQTDRETERGTQRENNNIGAQRYANTVNREMGEKRWGKERGKKETVL